MFVHDDSTSDANSQDIQHYIQHIYATGKLPDWRPVIEGDILNKHVSILEKWLQSGANQPLVIAQARIKSNPALAVYLDSMQGGNEAEDERFTTSKSGKRLIRLYSIEDIYTQPDPVYLIIPVFETIGVSLLYGMSGTGKTFSALNISLCIAHGIQWLGRRTRQGTVWYINTEGKRNLKKRLKAWYMEHFDISPTPHFHVIPWAVDLQENFQDLLNTIDEMEGKPALIVFDNFSMCSNANQKNQEEIAPVLRKLNTLAQEKECQLLILHHTNKEDDINGSMAFRNHVDTMIQLKKEDKSDKNSAILFCCQKSRDDEPFSDIKTELKQHTIHTDTFETITSCVVVASEAPLKAEGLKDTAQNILDILGERALLFNEWQKECIDTLKISSATFSRYRTELSNKNYIEKCKPDGKTVDHYRKVKNQEKAQKSE